jgi:NAD(P)-dependent dehydrogenase (short-subunit alcohol dehydrogenase family)
MAPRTIVITGASRGIGAATARAAAELGANVVLNARSEADLAGVARSIVEAGGQALAVPGDVSRRDDCLRLVQSAVERFGGLDAVVNNAAIVDPLSTLMTSAPEAVERALAVNVLGPLMLAQAAAVHLRPRKGCIVNVTSGVATFPVSGIGAYCASKAALNMCNHVLAKEEPELTVIAFDPGMTDTAMQTYLRTQAEAAMIPSDYAMFVGFNERGLIQPPDRIGRVLARVALRAPREWSGTVVVWDDERAQGLLAA